MVWIRLVICAKINFPPIFCFCLDRCLSVSVDDDQTHKMRQPYAVPCDKKVLNSYVLPKLTSWAQSFIDELAHEMLRPHRYCDPFRTNGIVHKVWWRAQWLRGRVLDSRPRDRAFEPLRRHCVVVLLRHIYPSLVLVQPRKNRPCLTERLLMGRKESKQTKH